MAFWTAADIVALKAAIASGVEEVEYDGPPKRRVKYQDLVAMQAVLAEMRSEVEAATSFRRVKWRRGFRS